MLYDTHTHFQNGDDIAAIITRAQTVNVTRLMAVGGSNELNTCAIKAAQLAPNDVRLALGFDRDQITTPTAHEELITRARALLTAHPVAALGEIGIDLYYSPDTCREQCDLFARELALADELQLPVVIHTREADDATLSVLDEVPWHHSKLRGIIHCYVGGIPFARQLIDRGFMISFSGIATFRAADSVRESAKFVPDDRLLIETDSPFLAPVPMRGRPNEPAFIVHTAALLAKVRNSTPEELAQLTYANAVAMLG